MMMGGGERILESNKTQQILKSTSVSTMNNTMAEFSSIQKSMHNRNAESVRIQNETSEKNTQVLEKVTALVENSRDMKFEPGKVVVRLDNREIANATYDMINKNLGPTRG